MVDGLRSQDVGFLMMHGIAVIIENLPANLPVLESELAVLETYLGDTVDEILAEIEHESKTAQRRRSARDQRLGAGDGQQHRKRKQ
jgi:hypothetical protein